MIIVKADYNFMTPYPIITIQPESLWAQTIVIKPN